MFDIQYVYKLFDILFAYALMFFAGWTLGANSAKTSQRRLMINREERRRQKLRSTQENVARRIVNALSVRFSYQVGVSLREYEGAHVIIVDSYVTERIRKELLVIRVDLSDLSERHKQLGWSSLSGGRVRKFWCTLSDDMVQKVIDDASDIIKENL